MKIKIVIISLLLILSTQYVAAQCSFQLSANKIDASCGANGAIEAILSFDAGSSVVDFSGFTYYLEDKSALGIYIPSLSNTDPYIGGLGAGTYRLTVKGLCSAGGVITKTVDNIVIESKTFNSFTVNYVEKVNPSLPTYGTGSLKFSITGAGTSDKYIVKVLQHPSSYTGPKQFIVNKSTSIIIGGLTYATSPSEYYRFEFSDGCNSVIRGNYNVDVLTNDFPPEANSTFRIYAHQDVALDGTFWPTTNTSKVILNYTNTNLSGAKTYQSSWYQIGYNTTNDHSSATWIDMPANYTNIEIPAIQGYSQYIANGNGSIIGAPYTWIRLKEYPSAVLFRQAKNAISTIPIVNLRMDQYQSSAKFVLDILNGSTRNALAARWLYSPLELRATSVDNPSITYSAFYNGDQTVPVLEVPWISPYTTSRKYKIELICGSGVDQSIREIGTVDISPGAPVSSTNNPRNFFSLIPCIDWGNSSIQIVRELSNSLSSGTRLNYNSTNWYIATNSNVFPRKTIYYDESENNDYYIYLTATDMYGVDASKKNIPSGSYEWDITVRPLDGSNFSETVRTLKRKITISKPDNPVVSTPYRQKLNSLTRVSSSCQDVTFSFDRDELWGRFKDAGGSFWSGREVVIGACYQHSSGVWQPVTDLKFEDSNTYTLTMDKASSTVKFTVNTDWPKDGNKDVYLYAYPGIYSITSTPFASVNEVVGVDGACYWLDTEPIVVNLNELTRVVIDNSKTGGYRCTTTNTAILEVAMTVNADYKVSLYVSSSSTPIQTKTVYNTNVCNFTGLATGVDNYTVMVENVSTGSTCGIANATKDIYIQTLDNPRFAGYEGGMDCVSGTQNSLRLKAASIIKTKYQWLDPDGIVITYANSQAKTYPGGINVASAANADYAEIEIPFSYIKEGQYTCLVEMEPGGGCGIVAAQTPYVSLDGGVPLYWSINAKDADWNNDENWNDTFGNTAYRIPTKCTDVFIPTKVNTYFPNLDTSTTTGTALCRDITFQYGAQTYFTNNLNYDKAFVEYNFQYYGDGVTPVEGTQPTVNTYDGITPHGIISGAGAITRGRWWMLASPLKEMVTGDFEFMGKPFSTRAVYNNPLDTKDHFAFNIKNVSDDNYFSVVADNNISLSRHYNSIMLFIPAYTGATGGNQDVLQDPEIKGVLRYPYFDHSGIKTARQITHSGTTTTINTYDLLNPSTITGSNDITRSYFNTTKKFYQANRFVYEQANGSIAKNSTGKSVYKMQITADDTRINGRVMIGNPFMSPIDFSKFYTDNSDKIKDYYMVLENGVWKTYTSASTAPIAAQQGFVVELKTATSAADLEFVIENVVKTDNLTARPKSVQIQLSNINNGLNTRGEVIPQHELLANFYIMNIDYTGYSPMNFIYSSWEDNNPGIEPSVNRFDISSESKEIQEAIVYGQNQNIHYIMNVISSKSDKVTLVIDNISPNVKGLTIVDTYSQQVYNLSDYKNKNGIIELDLECLAGDKDRFQLIINRVKP